MHPSVYGPRADRQPARLGGQRTGDAGDRHRRRDAAGQMLADAASVAPRAITVGADKNYDTAGFIGSCRANRVTSHVAQNAGRPGGSAIDGRTTRWAGYAVSQQKRKRIKQVFGWGKTVGRIRQVMYQGLERVDQLFVLTQVGYNLTRMRTLPG